MESIIGQSLEAAAATIEQNSEEGAASIAGTVSNASPHVRHTKSLSVLAPSWRSSNDEHICQEADAMHEKISNDQFNIHLSRPTFSARVLPPRKQKGLYTSMTPPTSNLDHDTEPEHHGDEVRRTHRLANDIDVLEIKVPMDSSIWKRISARSLHKNGDSHQDVGNQFRTSSLLTPLTIRNSELGLHFRITVADNGVIVIRLRGSINVELTVDNAIRVNDGLNQISASLSNTASSAALIHPNGRLHQYNSRIDIMAVDGLARNRYVRFAKMWYKGISFTNENSALTYLVDAAGARTTTDNFVNPNAYENLLNGVFFENSHHGFTYIESAFQKINEAKHFMENETEIFDNSYVRICQNKDGHVQIVRSNNKGTIMLNASKGSISFNTPMVYCTASLGKSSHLFVKRADRRLHFNGFTFCVRNAGHSAGFDAHNQFKIFN